MPHHQWITCITIFTFFMLPNLLLSEDYVNTLPVILFKWMDDKQDFRVGEIATIKVVVIIGFKNDQDRRLFNPNISVNNMMGNSSFVTGIHTHFGDNLKDWRIMLMPIMVGGLFDLIVIEPRFVIFDTIHYRASPGEIYEAGGIVSWMVPMNNFVAGMKATVLILPKDAFGNNVTAESEGQKTYDFVVSATYDNGSNVNLVDLNYKGWTENGYLSIEFVVITAGSLLVHIKYQNESLNASPLTLKVHPDALDVGNCEPHWRTETKAFQLSSKMETFIHQRDKYGNLVPELHEFDVEIINKGTKLSLPIADLQLKEVSRGIQSFSFTTAEAGDFILIISDKTTEKQILNMPYEFNVFAGYCDGSRSIINGSGLTDSRAGDVCKFSVFLLDAYEYPSPIELEKLEVQITVPSLSVRVHPQIYPKDSVNGTLSTGMLSYGAFGHRGIASVPYVYSYNNSAANWPTRSSDFDVVYVPEKGGVYEIIIFCGNIPLNNGRPFIKVVSSGEVNLSLSKVVKYEPKVSTLRVNYMIVQLMDSYFNPVLKQENKLLVGIASTKTHYHPGSFCDNHNGTYTGSFVMEDHGPYKISALFNGKPIFPYPLSVYAYPLTIFPDAYDDRVDVWEDQSIAFYALANDFFCRGDANIVGFQKPGHGSVLQYGNLLRYTPYKRYYGSDTFTYTFSDVNGINLSASVRIDVLTIPPQFVSSPSVLQVTEDTSSPKFGGFPSFMVTYSDSKEIISVKLSAVHGTVSFSPLLMQLWDPMWNEVSVRKEEGEVKYLYISGRVEAINFAIQSVQYIGEENFYGTDTITISTISIHGQNDLNVKIVVEPINDPPSINVPEFIILENEREDKGFLIFDRQRDKLNFSIGDPDHLHFPGNKTHFRVMISVEVTSGYFSAKLPAELISTTELKLQNSKQWQPLITFVKISRHFTVKAKGIRFQGTINDCNTLLHQLTYFGGKRAGVIKVIVDDMGWYGRYPDCADNRTVPLVAEATINLITRMPINSVVAHSLGSVMAIECIILSLLALTLMFFTCKCVIVLLREKKIQQLQFQELQLAERQTSQEQRINLKFNSSTDSSENMIHLAGNSSGPLTQSG